MSIPVIGLESMPNVYIQSASLVDDLFSISLTTKDFIDDPSWSESDILRGLLNIKLVVLTYDNGEDLEQVSNDLNQGNISIHDVSDEFTRIVGIQSYIPIETRQSENINNFYYNFSFTPQDLDFDKQNIYIYAIAYIDLTNLNLNYADYKYLDGPMASEAVRKNGRTPIRATLFRLEDGTIWSGPVHQHQDGYMEGSFHKEEPHSELTTSQVESKVSAFIFDITENETFDAPETISPFTESNETFDAPETISPFTKSTVTAPQFAPKDAPFFTEEQFFHYEQELDVSIVAIDTSNIALNEFETARELFNTNQQYFYELMKDFQISQFELLKAPLKRRLDFLDIGTRDYKFDDTLEQVLIRTSMVDGKFDERYQMRLYSQEYNVNPNNLVDATDNSFDINTKSTFEASMKIGYIKELPSNELFLHNLMIIDERYFEDESEDYRLKMNIDVIDSFKTTLEQTKSEILGIISDLSLTYNSLFGRLDKQRVVNFFSQNGIEIDLNLNFVRIESDALFQQSIFSRLSKSLTNILLALLDDEQVIQGVVESTLKNLYINTVSKENYNLVVSFLDNLVARFIRKYSLSSTNSRSVITNNRFVRVTRNIQKIIEVNRVKEGNFSYFDTDSKFITADQFRSRSFAEFDKFYSRQISAAEIGSVAPDLGNESSIQMADFEKSKYTFFTPVSYNYGDQKIDLGQADISIFDEDKHNIITDHMFTVNSRVKRIRRRGKARNRAALGPSPKSGKSELLTTIAVNRPFRKKGELGEDIKYENASNYLGSTSLFLGINLDTRRKEIKEEKTPATLIKKSFAQRRKIKSFDLVSLNNERSALLKQKNQIDFSRTPLQFRALILSNYNLSRFSFPLEEDQMLENPKFSTALNNIYNRIRIAQYLDTFERKENGLRDLARPIYLTLSDEVLDSGKSLMIKFSKFNNQLLQIQSEDQIPETNTFLFVEGTMQPASNSNQNQVSLDIASIDEKEFSTTNIIKQNQKRQELNNFVNPAINISDTRAGDRQVSTLRQVDTNQRRNVDRSRTLRPTRSSY